MVSEVVDMRAAFSVRMGLPATGAGHHPLYQQPQPQHHPHAHPLHQHHHLLMPSGPPFFPPPPLDSGGGDYGSSGGSPESPGYIQKQMQLLEQAGHHTQILMSGLYNGAPITDAQVMTQQRDAYKLSNKQTNQPTQNPAQSVIIIEPIDIDCIVLFLSPTDCLATDES
jgi:hypothetical protein